MTTLRYKILSYIHAYKRATIPELANHLHTSENHTEVLVNYLKSMEAIIIFNGVVRLDPTFKIKRWIA